MVIPVPTLAAFRPEAPRVTHVLPSPRAAPLGGLPHAAVGAWGLGLGVACGVRRRGGCSVRLRSSAACAATEKTQQETRKPLPHRPAVNFKKFFLITEDAQPLWYRLSDLWLTFVGAFLFYLSVCEPEVARRYQLEQVEDVVNVNFLVRFILLFWANDFKPSWLWTGKAILDLLSCLPTLTIPARFMGGAPIIQNIEIFEIARFLRLLRLSLPSKLNKGALGKARDPLQIVTVLIALGGTIVLSATLLFMYENTGGAIRSFEDTALFMVNIFTGKDTPFPVQTTGGKQVTAAATLVGALFLPFLISGGFQVIMGNRKMDELMGADESEPTVAPLEVPLEGSAQEWAAVLRRLDQLEDLGLLRPEEARELRRRCAAQEKWALALDSCYGRPFTDLLDLQAGKLYAARLREWINADDSGLVA